MNLANEVYLIHSKENIMREEEKKQQQKDQFNPLRPQQDKSGKSGGLGRSQDEVRKEGERDTSRRDPASQNPSRKS